MTSKHFYFDPFATGSAVFLGPTESLLMELAWEKGELTVKGALRLLSTHPPLAYTTVMTVLARLAAKGFLIRKKAGRSFCYSPAQDKKSFLAGQVKTVTDCLKSNF
jgi:predicted transcriptional regulator